MNVMKEKYSMLLADDIGISCDHTNSLEWDTNAYPTVSFPIASPSGLDPPVCINRMQYCYKSIIIIFLKYIHINSSNNQSFFIETD